MDQVNQDEQKALGIATRDLLLQIFEADDGGFMVVGGGIRLTPQNLHSLIEAVQNMVLAAFGGKPGSSENKKIRKDN